MRMKAIQITVTFMSLLVLATALTAINPNFPTPISASTIVSTLPPTQARPVSFVPQAPNCDPNWAFVQNPSLPNHNYLNGVAAVSSSDVWAVGQYYTGAPYQTLIEHWDGTSLSLVPSPNPGANSNELAGIAAVSSSDIWAVGDYQNPGINQTLVEHWDGSTWSVVPSPNVGTNYNFLTGITMVNSSNMWAVGHYYNGTVNQTLVEHWNGSTWSVIPSPNVGTSYNYLTGITAISSNDIWAVGYYDISGNVGQTLVEHWDGSTWSVAPSPNVGTSGNTLNGVAAVSSSDIWAVGAYNNGSSNLVEHWDGGTWSVVPDPGWPQGCALFGVAAVSSSDVWAVGERYSGGDRQTHIEHWDGSVWSLVPSPNPGYRDNRLLGVAAVSGTDVWGVGNYSNGQQEALVERYNPCPASPTPTITITPISTPTSTATSTLASTETHTATPVSTMPTFTATTTPVTNTPVPPTNTIPPTQTPVGASPTTTSTAAQGSQTSTSTVTPANTLTTTTSPVVTHTPASTPTGCPIEFTDVPAGSTFYPFVRCMACRGIINGYTSECDTGSPCFRPNNNVTRGQLSKIVSNAAGFQEPVGVQQYEDVPPGSTFYAFVWRLADRGYVSGYSCGGPSEPCGYGNLPYFRPNGNATRGQITKIVANAAGFIDPPNSQIFQDVPQGQTFYDFVQRLASRGVMGGYACGDVGEPCVPPGNMPYFRPASNASRGQTSKIVSNTFFPNCQTPANK